MKAMNPLWMMIGKSGVWKMIKLENGWQIDSDGRCYILQQEATVLKGDRKGEKYITNQTYHSTLKNAVQKLMNIEQMEVVSKNDMTLSQAVLDLHRLHDKFERLLKVVEGHEFL